MRTCEVAGVWIGWDGRGQALGNVGGQALVDPGLKLCIQREIQKFLIAALGSSTPI